MAAKKQTYEQAMKRLEEIVSRIDSNELDIDSLGVNLKEAQELINVPIGCAIFCMAYLYLSTLTYWQIIKAINKKAVLIGICKYKT